MILSVTINPLLERRYYFYKLDLNSVNRNGKLIINAGGKGINVSRQLNRLRVRNSALIFLGGNNGKLFREALRSENIYFSEITTRSETREASIIINHSEQKIYSFFSSDSIISNLESYEFVEKMKKAIATCDIVVFSGSSPCEEADKIFPEGIRIANRLDKISLCDTYGKHLEDCIDASPTIIHNNLDEIRSSLNLNFNTETEHLYFLEQLYQKGVKQAFITDGANEFYASNFDFHYKVTPPEIKAVDSTGSGDAFVAGIVYSWQNKLTFENQLKLATALGALNSASLEVCNIEPEAVNSITGQVKIEAIGKKLKEINDSPD